MEKIRQLINKKYGKSYHIDSLYKAKRFGVSKTMAKELEGVTGIPRLQWLYPDEYGNPWPLLKGIVAN